jgi:murein hydrolase activator
MNFRLLPIVILCLCAAGCFFAPAAMSEETAADKKRELERIQRELEQKQSDLKRASRKERSVLADLDKIDRDIQTGAAELAEQQKRLVEAERSLGDVERNSADLGGKLDEVKHRYALRLRALYKMRGSGSSLFDMDSLDGMARQIKYLGMIAERDNRIIGEYKTVLNGLDEQQQRISRKKREIIEQQHAVGVRKSDLETKRLRKAALLASVRQEKSLSNQALRELEESSANLWAMIRKEEKERRGRGEPHPAPGLADDRTGKSQSLPWPLEGVVITHFGMQRHPQFGTMVFRRGIEIAAHEGQAVHAVDTGQIAYADWYKGFGKLLILDHGNGFYSLYGNLSRLDFAKGDRVSKGQSIGLAGDAGTVKGAKLYFEIRRNGEAQDPLRWLAKR